MGKCEKLLLQAQQGPKNLRFEDLCRLAECYGYIQAGGSGSHRLYKRKGAPLMNFQEGPNGKAWPYQVKQLLKAVQELESTNDEGERSE